MKPEKKAETKRPRPSSDPNRAAYDLVRRVTKTEEEEEVSGKKYPKPSDR